MIFAKRFSAALAALMVQVAPPAATAASLTTVYSFGAPGDGKTPSALIAYKNKLYGATTAGGADSSGTLFSLDPHTGLETQLYSFTGAADGATPLGALLAYKRLFYGTTYGGGANGSGQAAPGTVFSLDPATGKEAVLHSFAGPDGSHPYGGLTPVGNYLYGTTSAGGATSNGTIFRISLKTNVLTVLHSFTGADGEAPYAGMVLNGGILYGTTLTGGSGGGFGNGVVFTYDPAAKAFAVLHSFATAEGSGIQDALTPYNGALYGAAYGGGATGSGTVFKVDPATGAVTVLYSFGPSPDGGLPIAGVTSKVGSLYGATFTGGAGTADAGAIYRVNPKTGEENVVYSFVNGADGGYPGSTLVLIGKTLYGTTQQSGLNGGGTVFKIR